MLVNATVNNSVYYPNGTLLRGGLSTEQSLGRFIYNFTLLSGAPTGTYSVDIDANYSGNEAHDILAFIATTGVNATVPEVIVDTPAVIYTNTLFDIIALTKSSGGLAADCTNNANITIRNSLNATTVINNVAMTNFSTGLYNYTWSTGVPSTYLAIVKCMISSLSGLFVDDTEANWAAGTHNQTTAIDGNLTLALNRNIFNYTGFNFSIADQETSPRGIAFNGTNFYIVGDTNDTVYEYNLTGNYTGFNFSIAAQETSPRGIAFNGTNFYVVGDDTDRVYGYSSRNYYPSGTFTSQVFNAGQSARWVNVLRASDESSAVNITFKVRSCDYITCNGESWSSELAYPVILNTTLTPDNQYFQYQAVLRTNDTSLTPVLEWTNISYSLLPLSAVEYTGMKVFSVQTAQSGGLPLNIFSSVGSSYALGDQVSIYAAITNSSGMLVNATVNNSVYYPNGTLLRGGLSTEQSLGVYNFSFTLSSSAPLGTYSIRIDANYSGNEVHDILAFIVTTTPASGGLPLNIFSSIGSSYALGDQVSIYATITNSSGMLVNATVNNSVYYPNGTLLRGGLSTEQSLGRFIYNFTLLSGAPTGTYSVDIDANYSGNEAHDILAFIATTGVNATVPEVIVDTPAVIYTNTLFDIIALTKSSGGLAADCTNNANITIRNSLNGTTVINNVAMTNFSTGLYNYTWSTGVPSTYLAIVKCMISSLSGLFVDDTEANWAAGTHNQTTAIDGNLTLALNSSMVNYTGFNFSIADQETSPQGLAFNGNRFYTIGDSSIRVYEYNLTGSYTGFNFSIAAQDTSPRGIAFNGSNFYIVGGTSVTVYEYNLTGNYTGFSFSVTAQEGSPRGIAFNGTNFYVVGDSNFTVYEYNLTGSYTGFNFSVAYQNTAPRGIAFNGTYFYVISASGIVYEYNLTGNYTGFNFSVAAQDAFAQGLAFNGTNFYVAGDDTDRVSGYSSRNYYT